MKDRFGRKINYMRISITDRCNLHCRYCMPENITWTPSEEILTCGEIERVCRVAVGLGITCFKVTGGEPLLREDCVRIIAGIKRIPGVKQVTVTTNGTLLLREWDALLDAGLDAVNISLDTTDRAQYERITGYDGLPQVLAAVDLAEASGVPVRINAVLQEGMNDRAWRPLAELARERALDVRFIELMPIGASAGAREVSNAGLLRAMRQVYPSLQPDDRVHGNGPAVYYRIGGFSGAVGFISALHGKFCSRCNRIRLTATGELKPCLCYDERVPIRELLRAGRDDAVASAMRRVISTKPQMHCFEDKTRVTESQSMVRIGG